MEFFPFLINSNIWVPFLMFSQVMHVIKSLNTNGNSQLRVHCLLVKAACMWSQDFFSLYFSVIQSYKSLLWSLTVCLCPYYCTECLHITNFPTTPANLLTSLLISFPGHLRVCTELWENQWLPVVVTSCYHWPSTIISNLSSYPLFP